MLPLFAFVAALTVGGSALSESMWACERTPGLAAAPSGLEQLVSSAVCTLALCLALDWALGYSHMLRPGPLIGCALVAGALGTLVLVRRRVGWRAALGIELPAGTTMLVIALLLPAALWLAFVLWRSSILPVLSHDGLNYHMPKAVMMMRAASVGYFDDASNVRISAFPNDYELLLTDVLVLTHSDSLTAWPSTFFYLLLLVTSGALAQRFWGPGLHVLAAPLLTGGAPVVLFHAGAHKNDLMMAALAVAAALWTARRVAVGGFAPAVLAVLCIVIGAGTKFTGLFVAVAAVGAFLASALLRRGAILRPLSRWQIAALVAVALLSPMLLGCETYVENLRHTHSITGPPGEDVMHPGYGRWSYLWQFPVLALLVPFSSDPNTVWVPWRGERWWWPSTDWYFSHYGMTVSIAVVASIVCVLRYRKLDEGTPRPLERRAATAVLGGAAVLFVPAYNGPVGFFSSYPRMLAFVVPLIACWSVVPLARELGERALRRVQRLLLAGLATSLAAYAFWCGTHDFYIPLPYLAEAVRHPGTRFVPCDPARAGSVVDALAGPDDMVAIDGDFDTNVYPVYGASLSRRIVFIRPGEGTVMIPHQARWVIVDRSWNAIWNNPAFTDAGKALYYLFRGRPLDADLRVYRQLRHDPAYRLVYRNKRLNQAIFVRADSVPQGLKAAGAR